MKVKDLVELIEIHGLRDYRGHLVNTEGATSFDLLSYIEETIQTLLRENNIKNVGVMKDKSNIILYPYENYGNVIKIKVHKKVLKDRDNKFSLNTYYTLKGLKVMCDDDYTFEQFEKDALNSKQEEIDFFNEQKEDFLNKLKEYNIDLNSFLDLKDRYAKLSYRSKYELEKLMK